MLQGKLTNYYCVAIVCISFSLPFIHQMHPLMSDHQDQPATVIKLKS